MIHFYLGLTLSLICLFLAYLILSKFLIVTVLCLILAGLYFKDDFLLSRYVAARVASFYSWICDLFLCIQNMYHQSNNTNFPIRKTIENNGAVPRRFDRLQHHSSSYNLSSSYVMDNKQINSGVWGSGSSLSPPVKNFTSPSHTQSTLHEMSKLNINHHTRGGSLTSDRYSKSYDSSNDSPLKITRPGYSKNTEQSKSGSSSFPSSLDGTSNTENKPPLDPRLYADISSPGFCGRIADRLHEEIMTHQSKYDTVGAFPVVNLKSQSPKIKIKPPVRVRLAPPSNELAHYNYGANSVTRSPIFGPDDSMKSVLQVLKEISRKRIHSHIDEENDEGSKRLRVTDPQFDSDGLLQTTLLQQTIQGKRAREESSPNEDDKKRRKASLKNNEIFSSLSSSISIQPPHLQTAKRKAQAIDDSITSTPVLGKLLKVQTDITPPSAPTNHIAAPDTSTVATASIAAEEELTAKTFCTPDIPSPIVPSPAFVEPETVKAPAVEVRPVASNELIPEEDGAVSRLLGRMSDQTSCSSPIPIPIKKNVFMSTNDLSLSPPKENRLAAMIAVLGGPSEQSELENIQSDASKQPERLIKGKALFTTPETPATPETPKQSKKVTFSASLTTTKIFERDESVSEYGAVSKDSQALPSTPLSSVPFGPSVHTIPTDSKLNFGFDNVSTKPFALNFSSSPTTTGNEAAKPNERENFTMSTPTSSAAVSTSPGHQNSMFQVQHTNLTSATAVASVSAPTFSTVVQVSNSSVVNAPSQGGFSFGTNSSLVNVSKESSAKTNSDTPPVKSFSFGTELKTSQTPQPVSGFPSIFSPTTMKSETTAAKELVSPTEQNKPMFNVFGNKDSLGFASKKEGEIKPLVNGFAPTSINSSPFSLSQPVSQSNASKPLPSFGGSANPTTTSQSTPTFNFGSATAFSTNSASATMQQSTSSTFTSTTQQANTSFQPNSLISAAASPSVNIFSSSANSPAQSKQSPFGSGSTSAFGDNAFKPVPISSQPSQANSLFGNTPSQTTAFGSTPVLQNGAVSSTSGMSQNNKNMFGSISSNATNKPIIFGSEPNATTQPSSVFGFSGSSASTQANSPFGITLNNSTSNTPNIFGSTTTVQSASVFGSGASIAGSKDSTFSTPSTTSGGQPSLFGNKASSDASKNLFAGASNSNPTFGGLGSTSSSAFGNQGNPAPTFGGQNTTSASTFGNQSTPGFTFGSQNSGSNSTPGGFGAAGTFAGSSNGSSTNEVKTPAFGSGSPFMFGSSSDSKPTDTVKPLGTASPFAFGSSAQQSSSSNPVQPSVPSFVAPTPTFGTAQPTPTFGAGASQPAAPTFQFGQTSSSPAPAFQFNAAPPTAVGGMFSIGSGGSSTSRPKTTALRRSHKRT